jgi:hypothetical protein
MRQLNKERRDKMQPKKPMETNVRKNDSLVATTIILKRKNLEKNVDTSLAWQQKLIILSKSKF